MQCWDLNPGLHVNYVLPSPFQCLWSRVLCRPCWYYHEFLVLLPLPLKSWDYMRVPSCHPAGTFLNRNFGSLSLHWPMVVVAVGVTCKGPLLTSVSILVLVQRDWSITISKITNIPVYEGTGLICGWIFYFLTMWPHSRKPRNLTDFFS